MSQIIENKVIELNGKYINVCDAAEILQVSYSAILKRIRAGKITGSQNHKVLIPKAYVEEAMSEFKKESKK